MCVWDTVAYYFIVWVKIEIAAIPLVLLLARAMWQNGDGSRPDSEPDSPGP